MADDPWLLKEDGYLNIDPDLKQIIYHSSLNVILVCTDSETVHVLDVNSGVVLHSSRLSAQADCAVTCRYLPDQDKVLFCDGHGIGVRSDYNGVLLLDTILQKPVASSKDVIKLELLLSEAILLKQSLISLMNSLMLSQQSRVFTELCDKIAEAQKQTKKGIKAQKWNTVCLELPLDVLKRVAESAVTEFMLKNQHVPELAVASAVEERLCELTGEAPQATDRAAMASEARRRDTFSKWPHMDYKWALPDQMAQAGFFHQPNSSGGDRAMCFTCTVCLVCWERTDEPWSEHERHSPTCPFVMGEYTQNVPLSVTYATAPALDATYRGCPARLVGRSAAPGLVATAAQDGLVSVYDASGRLRRTHSFYVRPYDSPVLECCVRELGPLEQDATVAVAALCVVGGRAPTSPAVDDAAGAQDARPTRVPRPAVVCGLRVGPGADTGAGDACLCLAVYDFQYARDGRDVGDTGDAPAAGRAPRASKVFISPDDIDSLMDTQLSYPSNDSEVMTFINNMNYEAFKMIKETINYQHLIPGESDSIFLPPQPGVAPGTRGWSAGAADAPAALPPPPPPPQDAPASLIHQYINDQLHGAAAGAGAGADKSISDHIAELRSGQPKRLNYSHAVQCVPLPVHCKGRRDLDILDLVPTYDGTHLLVVLCATGGGAHALLLYAVERVAAVARLDERVPLAAELPAEQRPVEVSVLPAAARGPAGRPAPLGLAVLVCADGAVRIVDLLDLRVVCMARLDADRFVSATYCHSLERLCAATRGGALHFYALHEADAEPGDGCFEDDDSLAALLGGEVGGVRPDAYDHCIVGGEPGAVLPAADLCRLSTLCSFELLNAAYCVVVPPCWSEMQQAQRQRRHPQCLSGDDHHTRTWRLQTDATTWDEHIFEITLPWPVCVGHMDVHFSLHAQLGPPHVEVTLLRQNTAGIGHRRAEVKFQVDEMVSFDNLQLGRNPVTSREYLRSHNADILAGPINLADCVDLTDQGGCVTLTSPRLLRTSIRTVLLHIKALCDPSKEHAASTRKAEFKRGRGDAAASSSTPSAANGGAKAEYYMGCDCLHELSITIYKVAQADTAPQRLQRNAMLESGSLLLALLRTAADGSSLQGQRAALDILVWAASVRLARSRCASGEAPAHQPEFLAAVERELEPLLRHCLLAAGRSIARKCVKFVVICSDGARNVSDAAGRRFDEAAQRALLQCLPDVGAVWSAGALHWLVVLTLRTVRDDGHATLAAQCLALLGQAAQQLAARTNPYHLLLRSRFGLFGTPLEPELFDVEPTAAATRPAAAPALSDEPTDGRPRAAAPAKHMRGLLETEPLHFVCVAASDGTRVERFDPGAAATHPPGLVASVMVHAPHAHHHSGTKKADGDDLKDKDTVTFTAADGKPMDDDLAYSVKYGKSDGPDAPDAADEPVASADARDAEPAAARPGQCALHQLLLAPPHQVMVVERMQSGARRFITLDFGAAVLLTDVMVPACHDLVSLSLDLWLRGEDVDAVRLALATDIGAKSLVLSDLQPPPVCRYVKITTIGRYGMSATRCRIPVGSFYGHMVVLPEEVAPGAEAVAGVAAGADLERRAATLSALLEDVGCRYSLACSRLKDLLRPWLTCDVPNAAHMAAYMGLLRDQAEQAALAWDGARVLPAYQQAVQYQRQLNVVQTVVRRVRPALAPAPPCTLTDAPADKLRAVAEALLDVLLALSTDVTPLVAPLVDLRCCRRLFHGLCVAQPPRLQAQAAALLVRACGRQPYWGDFLADTLAHMFSSGCTAQFPQDRVFVLLVYLGRRSPERGAVLDAALRALAHALAPLAPGRPAALLLAVRTDLSLLGWLLLFLSLQLDGAGAKGDALGRRWNWVSGDAGARASDGGVCTGNQRRKVHRRFLHYKQQVEQLDWTKKAVQASTQALSALSCQAASLSSKIAAALKQQEHVFKKIKQLNKQKELGAGRAQDAPGASRTSRAQSTPRDAPPSGRSSPRAAHLLDADHCLAVVRGLVALLLAVDHSCSADMFLLACKVVARLALMAGLPMSQALTGDQLQRLVRQYVHSDQPWMQHALACLLQDLLEVASDGATDPVAATVAEETFAEATAAATTPTDGDADGQQPAGPSWAGSSTAAAFAVDKNPIIAVSDIFDSISFEEKLYYDKMQADGKATAGNQLPSVFESDDSDLDEFLDDILERGRSLLRRNGTAKAAACGGNVSSALDARLELGVEVAAEIQLRRLTAMSAGGALPGAGSPASEPATPRGLPAWPAELLEPWAAPGPAGPGTTDMLSACFDRLLENIELQPPACIEHTLRLWLALNRTSGRAACSPATSPAIPVRPQSIGNLVSALVYCPGLSLRTWYVALQALTLACNMPAAPPADWLEHSLGGMARCLAGHQDLVPLLLRLLSGAGLTFSSQGLAGPSLCRALHELLVRLLTRCDAAAAAQARGLLLRALHQLVQPGGALSTRQGPLDLQCKFVHSLLLLDYADADLDVLLSILESTGVLVCSHVSAADRVKCVNLGERNSTSASYFSGLFASVLGADSGREDRPATWELMLVSLLKLLTKLVQTPVRDSALPAERADPTERAERDTQTDESKAERRHGQEPGPGRVPCLADAVLRCHPSVMRLCQCLAACGGSSLAMLVGCTQQPALADLGEPTTVADAVFQLLSVMTLRASRPALVLEPLVKFLRSAPQLSEPLLWFMLQTLHTEHMLRGFLRLDGVRVLAESMVRSGRTLSSVHHGHVSLVMHHMAAAAAAAAAAAVTSASAATTSATSCSSAAAAAAAAAAAPSAPAKVDGGLSYAAPSLNKKVQQASMESAEALVNFAPLGSIRCHSGTAQPADVLIQQAVAPHRRARTPQWCYHFYPDETHTDLTVRLPCAVLLREVQLQPHLSSLSTCPSAVALEVSSGGPEHLVPASPPFPTSGMTFIRLHLPTPEVVTHVLLRLYKPRDASNIGLSQIRLLGTSAFGGGGGGGGVHRPAGAPWTGGGSAAWAAGDASDEEAFSRFSLGWLRLLHHCFTLPPAGSELEHAVVAAAAGVPDLLATCCGLLLVPTHIPTLYLPNLERVLCKLSLHDRQSGLAAIGMLLDSRAALAGCTHVLLGARSQPAPGSPATQSVCELLHQVCGHEDTDTPYRVHAVLCWLQRAAQRAANSDVDADACSAAFVSCVAAVLWSAREAGARYGLRDMVTVDLFDTVFRWVGVAHTNAPLKGALDCLLCSLCYIRTELFPSLLQAMGVLVPIMSTDRTASITDDRKDSQGMTDDGKRRLDEPGSEWYGRLVMSELTSLSLSDQQLGTIAVASRSPPGTQQLLDSGLPKLLTCAILELCSGGDGRVPMARLENVAATLRFLADVCGEQPMRDWLGTADGSSFWLPLLRWLCDRPAHTSRLHSEARAHLEEVCVRFLAKCCLCHAANQRLLARVLCTVIGQQPSGISGFMRRLVLQLLLQHEKVPVCIKADETIYKVSPMPQPAFPPHPAHKRTHDRVLLHLSTSATIGEILDQHVVFVASLKTDGGGTGGRVTKDAAFGVTVGPATTVATPEELDMGVYSAENIMAAVAGVTAKEKRAKDVKNQGLMCSTPKLKKKRYNTSEVMAGLVDAAAGGGRIVRCEGLPEHPLPPALTLAQLLALLGAAGGAAGDAPCLHLTVGHARPADDRPGARHTADADLLLQQPPISNALQVFSSLGGLALLAQHLPAVYPEAARPPACDKPASTTEQPDADWVKVEGSDDIYEDLEDLPGSSAPAKAGGAVTNVPPHSLTAFGLFLRLPGYAEVLLRDARKALCLLRLVLGVTDDGEGGDIFQSPVAASLPTLPFEVLRQLYDGTPLGTDDGRVLRSTSVDVGVTNLLLGCLAVFTHQVQPHAAGPGDGRGATDDKNQLYWAKGTGFGTGSTQQSWNVEQALLRQRSEEEHVTVLLQVLASYVNPRGAAADDLADPSVLPAGFEQQVADSCLLAVLSSYLRNDSVLDMARHIPLYRAVLQLLRALSLSPQLVRLLVPGRAGSPPDGRPPIASLLHKMKCCVDNYTCRLRFNKSAAAAATAAKNRQHQQHQQPPDELEPDEGLALLMPDIQETADLVRQATSQLAGGDECEAALREAAAADAPPHRSAEHRYLDVMRPLQFDTCEMIAECPEGYKFVVSYHFEGNVRQAGEQSQPARMKRLAQEAVTLATSLPLSYSSSVFVRCDADRLDIMKVLITGPADTPYANGCFELDVYFPADYPKAPMLINLETTGRHTVRFNPNLYNDGKVCLSVLNTWHGRPEEKWNAQTSSFLQVLVSIQSLILVSEPYFNEPGYERSRGTPTGTQSSREYNANICQATVRWAMLEQILNPCPCFKDVIHTHFWLKRHEILAQVEGWIADMEAQLAEKRPGRSASKRATVGNLDAFKKNYHQLRDQLAKLPPPAGLEREHAEREAEAAARATALAAAAAAAAPAAPSAAAAAAQFQYHQQHDDMDAADIDMEKLVSEVCE